MKLSFEKICEISQGVAYVSKNGNYIQFHRFNKSEEDYYNEASLNESWARHYSTSGVKLIFCTNSTTLKLKVNVEEATPTRYFSHDIFCNKKLIGNIRNFAELPADDFNLGMFEAKYDLGKGIKEISIVFPWSVNSMLEELIVDDGALIFAIKNDYKIVSYGDSITYGASAAFPSNRYMAKLSEEMGAEEICKAVGGEVFCPELLDYAKEASVKYVTVAYGTNELYNDFDGFQKRCRAFFEKLSSIYSESLIFAISPIWRKDNENKSAFARMTDIKNEIKKTVSRYDNIVFIEGSDLVPCNLTLFADRCLHPNDEGFEYYYKNLFNKIQGSVQSGV